MQLSSTQNKILAILFACGDPIEIERIAEVLELDRQTAERLISHLDDYLESSGLPFQIIRLESKIQLCTRSEYSEIIKSALEIRRNIPLSQAALEVLAIIAYNQPVTKAFIEQVRGVDSSGVVTSLVEKALVEEAGRLELPGRPIAYKTTPVFLRSFGLSSLGQLPSAGELSQPDYDEDKQDDAAQAEGELATV